MPTDNSVEYRGSLSHEIMKSRMSKITVDVVHVHGGCIEEGNVKENPPEFQIRESSNCSEKQRFFEMHLNHTLKKAFRVHLNKNFCCLSVIIVISVNG